MKTRHFVRNDKIDNLFSLAKKRGYISQDEIMEIFPKPEEHVEELDQIYDHLIKKEIYILVIFFPIKRGKREKITRIKCVSKL